MQKWQRKLNLQSKENPPNKTRSIVSIPSRWCRAVNITHGEDIELLSATSSRRINWEKNWPCDAATNEHNNHGHSQKSKEQVSIETLVLKGVDIWNFAKRANPIEPSWWKRFRSFSVLILVLACIVHRILRDAYTHSSRNAPRYVLGAYHRTFDLRKIKKMTK